MARIADAVPGARFGQLIITGATERRDGKTRVPVRCDCGTEKTVQVTNLGVTTESCGCVRSKLSAERKTTHGLSKLPEYTVWLEVIRRCTDDRRPYWANYGGRGITICDEWRQDFPAFFAHVGPRPTPNHSLDRINNDGNYEPGNIRWATKAEQAQNQRRRFVCKRNHRIEGDNEGRNAAGRFCRACNRLKSREAARAYRANKRAQDDVDTEQTLTIPLPAR